MKKTTLTKLLGIVLIMALVMSMGTVAFAADSITISVDASGTPDENTAAEVYTAYKIFDVVKASTITGDSTTDDTIAAQPANPLPTGYAYTIAKNSKWYSVVETNLADYITLTAAPGDDTIMVVTLKDGVANNEATAKAMASILENNIPTDAPSVSVTLEQAATADPGYYLIVSSIGTNLILGTTNINITQKNTYPTIDKKEKDEDTTNYTDGQGDAKVKVAVGDTIEYQITVNVPASAKADIYVTDTMSTGLSYTDGLTGLTAKCGEDDVTLSAVASNDTNYDANATWQAKFTPSDATRGKDVVITFTATVTSAALTDTNRKNTVKLDFSNFAQSDYVEYTTYYTGIIKVDGSDTTVPLEGVKFTLKESDAEFKVSKPSGKDYYIPDANGSSTVVTDANGKIIIRGLDDDKTYTLTETETNDGYNLLDAPKTLTLIEDTFDATSGDPTYDANTEFDKVLNNKGTVLPSTGGIGTTIFYVVGSILVVAAGVLLITKKRMSREG